MAKKQNIVAEESAVVDTPIQEHPDNVVQENIPTEVVAEEQSQIVAYVKPPEYQAKALEEQGAFDYHIQGAEAVLKSPYTEGSAEHFHYAKGWNDAFNADNKG